VRTENDRHIRRDRLRCREGDGGKFEGGSGWDEVGSGVKIPMTGNALVTGGGVVALVIMPSAGQDGRADVGAERKDWEQPATHDGRSMVGDRRIVNGLIWYGVQFEVLGRQL
jgi:hypothetical protein